MKPMLDTNGKFYHIFMLFWFISITLIVLGSFMGKLRFGYGLGDLLYVLLTIGILLVFGGVYLYDRFKGLNLLDSPIHTYVIIFCTLVLVFLILKITILRGPESSWDGRIIF